MLTTLQELVGITSKHKILFSENLISYTRFHFFCYVQLYVFIFLCIYYQPT